jgi:glyoxylase-like metal-dependent hydrolase (beta-lactamase superfamily II)
MKIAQGIATVDLTASMQGRQMTIHPTLIWDDEEVILVDTGIPGQLDAIRAEMESVGVPFEKLTKVILTHQDVDHIGSLPEILKVADHKIEVLAHAEDKPYIEGDKPLIKVNPERIAKMVESLPPEEQQKVQAIYGASLNSKIDRTVEDGEVLPYSGGITVIFTPGHTPGHISLYHQASKTLITGDATVATEGVLTGPNRPVTPDLDEALKSLEKFTKYDVETVICYHGGIVRDNVPEQLLKLAELK